MSRDKSFWTTAPGILTGLAAVITAVGGLVITLHQIGVFGVGSKSPVPPVESPRPPLESTKKDHFDRSLVNHTYWKVEVDTKKRGDDYHSVRWKFEPDGEVKGGKIWTGKWEPLEGSTDKVKVTLSIGDIFDIFEVHFTKDGKRFTAWKDGREYRYGDKVE